MSAELVKYSLIEATQIPNEFGVAVLLIALVLLLAPYLSGHDFGVVNVPKFSRVAKRNLRYQGPAILSLAILLLPIWRTSGEVFVHPNGNFRKVGEYWVQYHPYDDGRNFSYREECRENGYIYALDASRSMYIKLPIRGGMSQWAMKDQIAWIDYHRDARVSNVRLAARLCA